MGGQSEIHSLQGMKEKGNGPQIHQWLSPFSLPREDWAWKYYQNGEFFTQSKEDSRGQWSFLSQPAPSKLELWVWAFGLQNKDSAQRCWVRPTKKGEPHVLRENSTERPFLDSCPVVSGITQTVSSLLIRTVFADKLYVCVRYWSAKYLIQHTQISDIKISINRSSNIFFLYPRRSLF